MVEGSAYGFFCGIQHSLVVDYLHVLDDCGSIQMCMLKQSGDAFIFCVTEGNSAVQLLYRVIVNETIKYSYVLINI